MTQAAEKILSEAMKLDEAERAELAAKLMDTFDAEIDSGYADAWEREIEARIADLKSGKAKAYPFDCLP
jgi:putative addiction module component (TIGR02574 family)